MMARIVTWGLGIFLICVGLALIVGGAWLVLLGGSPYYLVAGLGCMLSGALICRKRRVGVLVYGGIVAGTIAWALWEVGPDFWLLLPRIGGPLAVMLLMLTPWVQGALAPTGMRAVGKRPAVLAVVLLLVVGGLALTLDKREASVTAGQTGRAEPVTDWADYAANQAGTRFSAASQITPSNVSGLKVAWTYRTGDLPQGQPSPQMFEATPLQIGDTLYLCTPHDIVIALDADKGTERWRFDPKVDSEGVYTVACRGLAFHQSSAPAAADCPQRLLVATIDGRMIAVSAATGRRCRKFGQNGEISLRADMGAIKGGWQFNTSPPAVVGDAAIIGGFVLDNMGTDEPSGVVRAFNALDGALMWNWDAGRKVANAALKPGETYTRSSPNAWSLFSADEKLGLVYVPTGNPSPDHFGGRRNPEMERYGSSVVALDVTTGAVSWAFQTVHHDLWDYDVASQPMLADVPVGGHLVPGLIQATKQGEIFLLDRRDGRPLAPIEEIVVPRGNVPGERYAPTQPVSHWLPSLNPPPLREADMWGATPLDQLWCRIAFRRLRYLGRFTPPSFEKSVIFPGNNGIMNWGSAAFDPDRQVLVVPTSYMPLVLNLIPRKDAPAVDRIVLDGRAAISPMSGTPYAVRTERPFVSPLGVPCNAPPWGRLTAFDLKTRQVLWQRPLGTTADHAPLGIPVPGTFNQGGAMITRSGLIFIGATLDNYLRAFDLKSGKELWKGRLPAGGQAMPMTFVSPRTGKQYVVIAAGGHAFMHTTIGDNVVAYRLGD
jgi:quinoprotein glucose dehydrogenase/quinate dehydrogenase (quinone)